MEMRKYLSDAYGLRNVSTALKGDKSERILGYGMDLELYKFIVTIIRIVLHRRYSGQISHHNCHISFAEHTHAVAGNYMSACCTI